MIDQRITVLRQLFSWASLSKCQINKMIDSRGHLTVSGVPRVSYVLPKNFSQKIFSKWINFQIGHWKKFHRPLSKINLHYQTLIDQKLTVFHQLFSWTSVVLSICPIDKMIGSKGHLTLWAVPWLPCVLVDNSFTENFLQINKFLK